MSEPNEKTANPAKAKSKKDEKPKEKEGMRETMEAVVFAFFLAFLFRTFEAEAFVIPTGSMAPTLYGRHKEMCCEKCGYKFAFGASREVTDSGYLIEENRIQTAICLNCRYENPAARAAPAYGGDRILVNKFAPDFGDPERFDVTVFKYPEDPKTNYIKRLVGLSGETLRIQHGDLFRKKDAGGFEILRKKDPNKQKAIQMVVYDDKFPESDLIAKGWPNRWASVTKGNPPAPDQYEIDGWSETDESWIRDDETRSYRMGGERAGTDKLNWLRYRHFVPSTADWNALIEDRALRPKAKLISDFCGYNAARQIDRLGRHDGEPDDGALWVSDLNVEGTIELFELSENAELVFELTEGVYWYRCRINPNTGEAKLTYIDAQQDVDDERDMATGTTPVTGPGKFTFLFANVDDRICLWINDSLIDFGGKNTYERLPTDNHSPQLSDLTPIGIAVKGSGAMVKNLIIKRDLYYRGEIKSGNNIDYANLRSRLDDPNNWKQFYDSVAEDIDFATFEIPDGEFLVLGDNSPGSKDSRLWDETHTVPRRALLGKAFFIFWPRPITFGGEDGNGYTVTNHTALSREHGKVKTNYPSFSIPFYPNFPRMHRIR